MVGYALALTAAAVSAFPAGSYSCEMTQPKWLYIDDNGPSVRNLDFPNLKPDDWKFELVLARGAGVKVTPVAGDPLRLAGAHGVMSTDKGNYVWANYSEGPCVLTGGGCAWMVQMVQKKSGELDLLISPAATMLLDDDPVSEPFIAITKAQCVADKATQ